MSAGMEQTMRKRSSFEKVHGPVKGPRLLRALQQKSSASSRVAKIKGSPPSPLRRTTLDMDPALWTALKVRAAEEGRTMRTLLLAALTDYLSRPKGEGK
jgi:hypothetical protein